MRILTSFFLTIVHTDLDGSQYVHLRLIKVAQYSHSTSMFLLLTQYDLDDRFLDNIFQRRRQILFSSTPTKNILARELDKL